MTSLGEKTKELVNRFMQAATAPSSYPPVFEEAFRQQAASQRMASSGPVAEKTAPKTIFGEAFRLQAEGLVTPPAAEEPLPGTENKPAAPAAPGLK